MWFRDFIWHKTHHRGCWCLKVGGAGRCTAGKEVSMVTLKWPPPTWAPSYWSNQWNTYQPTAKLLDLPKRGWAGQKLWSLRASVRAKWALRMIASSKLHVELTRSPCEGPGPPQALCGQREWAANRQGCKQVSCIQRLLESIASRLTLL